MKSEEETSLLQRQAATMSAQALEIRLDTTRTLRQVEMFLRGVEIYSQINEQTGKEDLIERQMGPPLANREGQQMLLMWVKMRINSSTVQGNFKKEEHFREFISDMYLQLTDDVLLNMIKWGIEDSKLQFIISSIMEFAELFLSRTIDNQERLLFGTTKESFSTRMKAGIGLGGIGSK